MNTKESIRRGLWMKLAVVGSHILIWTSYTSLIYELSNLFRAGSVFIPNHTKIERERAAISIGDRTYDPLVQNNSHLTSRPEALSRAGLSLERGLNCIIGLLYTWSYIVKQKEQNVREQPLRLRNPSFGSRFRRLFYVFPRPWGFQLETFYECPFFKKKKEKEVHCALSWVFQTQKL